MKKLSLVFLALLIGLTAAAKDIKEIVLTTTPQMHCASCEKRIKDALRFEKGVKSVTTSIEAQTVTVSYDADKTTPERLVAALKKAGYEAREANASACCGGKGQKACCGGKQGCAKSGQSGCAAQQGCAKSGQGCGAAKQEADGAAQGGCCGKQAACGKKQGDSDASQTAPSSKSKKKNKKQGGKK
ncbi:MAG: cation transporter [Bacteroidaceae bacterium]|nr:cation transporter [Bacteroidaceae bacterium]